MRDDDGKRNYEKLDGVTGHDFPRALLEQINENSKGGYILVWLDENESPAFSANFDNEIIERGMFDFALQTLKILRDIKRNEQAMMMTGDFSELLRDDDDNYTGEDDDEEGYREEV